MLVLSVAHDPPPGQAVQMQRSFPAPEHPAGRSAQNGGGAGSMQVMTLQATAASRMHGALRQQLATQPAGSGWHSIV
jgi:hypothetical protein